MKVVKFGGTSLATADQIKKVGRIMTSDPERRIMVVSAPGKRNTNDIKITDLLIHSAERFLSGEGNVEVLAPVIERFQEIAAELSLGDEIREGMVSDLYSLLLMEKTCSGSVMDSFKAAGEDTCAKLVASYLQRLGLHAAYVSPREAGLLVSGEQGNARVLPETTVNLRGLRDRKEIVVLPGFFGYTPSGELVTFSRGGSDITGSIVAAAVGADLYENFTDVDSVFAVNPALIPNPKQITELTYREMRELSYAGFTVFHEEALLPAFRAKVPVCIKNTNNPDAPGTMIVSERCSEKTPIVGIAGDGGFCTIYMTKYLMNREIGFGRKLLGILEEEGIPYEHTPTGIDNFSVIIRESLLQQGMLERIVERIRFELQVDELHVVHHLALIMIVGEGMMQSVGMAARAATALAKAGVNLEMINQGCSEVSLMFGVRQGDAHKAVASLYHEFFYEEILSSSLLKKAVAAL